MLSHTDMMVYDLVRSDKVKIPFINSLRVGENSPNCSVCVGHILQKRKKQKTPRRLGESEV